MSTKKPSYYGAFFWVAAISFIVPLVVAAKAFHAVPVTTKPVSHPDASGVDHNLWDYLLKTYVDNGLVDYDGLSRDYLLRTYLRQLAECDPQKLTTTVDRLALVCNAYNAFVINGVITHKVHDSVLSYEHNGSQFFDLKEHILAGSTMSLNHLEHEIIRKTFSEPRVHVALVCAAKSCPAIRSEAYIGPRVMDQLTDQSPLFANDPRYVAFDAETNQLRLSPILKWYGSDFDDQGGYLKWLLKYAHDEALRQGLNAASDGRIEVAWFDYDWSLNSQTTPASATGARSGGSEFGSGSIPNE